MTVQELIDALQKIEDKSLEVSLFTSMGGVGHAVGVEGITTEDRFCDNAPCCELYGSDGESCDTYNEFAARVSAGKSPSGAAVFRYPDDDAT